MIREQGRWGAGRGAVRRRHGPGAEESGRGEARRMAHELGRGALSGTGGACAVEPAGAPGCGASQLLHPSGETGGASKRRTAGAPARGRTWSSSSRAPQALSSFLLAGVGGAPRSEPRRGDSPRPTRRLSQSHLERQIRSAAPLCRATRRRRRRWRRHAQRQRDALRVVGETWASRKCGVGIGPSERGPSEALF